MRPYLVWSYDYYHDSAGQKTMHRLCHELNLAGQEAYVGYQKRNPDWNTPYRKAPLSGLWIAVYPEIVRGSPWAAPYVARYVLNNPGKLGGDKTYHPSEMVFAFHEAFNDMGVPPGRILYLPTIELDIYFDRHLPRDIEVFYVGKGEQTRQLPGAIQITDDLKRDQRLLADTLNRAAIILDNGHEPPIGGTVDARGMGLYAMWNLGWRMAVERFGTVNVAILNDDIELHPGSLTMMATALRLDRRIGCVYPDVRTGFARGLPPNIRLTPEWDPAGGRSMSGFCFMFKGELRLPPFDEGMEWWYGDSEFDEEVKKAGYGVARVDHLPILHVSDAETNDWARRPELKEAIERDGVRWSERHDHIVDGRWVPR